MGPLQCQQYNTHESNVHCDNILELCTNNTRKEVDHNIVYKPCDIEDCRTVSAERIVVANRPGSEVNDLIHNKQYESITHFLTIGGVAGGGAGGGICPRRWVWAAPPVLNFDLLI